MNYLGVPDFIPGSPKGLVKKDWQYRVLCEGNLTWNDDQVWSHKRMQRVGIS